MTRKLSTVTDNSPKVGNTIITSAGLPIDWYDQIKHKVSIKGDISKW